MRKKVIAIAVGLTLTALSAPVLAQTTGARGLDFRSYLSLQRGMTEGQVLSIAGEPDMLANQGVVIVGQSSWGWERAVLPVITYTYLPTAADPFTTTIRLVGGRVTEIQRDKFW